MEPTTNPQPGLSSDTKTLIVVITLILVYPIGIILMYRWMKWSGWLKFLLALPLWIALISIVVSFGLAMLTTINPKKQIEKANCVKLCANQANKDICLQECQIK